MFDSLRYMSIEHVSLLFSQGHLPVLLINKNTRWIFFFAASKQESKYLKYFQRSLSLCEKKLLAT